MILTVTYKATKVKDGQYHLSMVCTMIDNTVRQVSIIVPAMNQTDAFHRAMNLIQEQGDIE